MSSELGTWLQELKLQQRQRDHRISEVELYRSFDRWLDAFNAARAQGGAMITDAGEPLHIPLITGEIITITTVEDRVLVALYAAKPDTGSAGDDDDDDTVLPAQAMQLTADECETLGSLLTLAAVSVYGQRHRLRAVEEPDDRRS